MNSGNHICRFFQALRMVALSAFSSLYQVFLLNSFVDYVFGPFFLAFILGFLSSVDVLVRIILCSRYPFSLQVSQINFCFVVEMGLTRVPGEPGYSRRFTPTSSWPGPWSAPA